ncbi:MAG TPA: carboxypeptidase-like regulatory domain-containing protein, partial [Planctomycetota bacterium]|nr:carboxypeptidase-like regulatory domain-containing protein [Planctomycetota bacterium]
RIEIRGDGVAKEIRAVLQDGLSLSGTIKADAAVPFAVVTVRDGRGLAKTATADKNGRYEIRGLAPGTYSYSVGLRPGERPQTGRIAIKRGANRFDITLR